MNTLLAEEHLRNLEPKNAKLADVYDDDETLQSALSHLFPGFEYPDYSYLTLGELWKRYSKNPLPR